MKLSPTQLAIFELLEKTPLSIKDISSKLTVSESYVRVQVKLLEEMGQVEKADERLPYIYRIPEESPRLRHKSLVKECKLQLVNPNMETNSDLILKARKLPKTKLPDLADKMEAIVEAIRQLDAEGKLIDTL